MSQSDASVYFDLILRRREFSDDLRLVKDEVQTFKREAENMTANMSVITDLSRARSDLDGFILQYSDTPIVIPVVVDTASLSATIQGAKAAVSEIGMVTQAIVPAAASATVAGLIEGPAAAAVAAPTALALAGRAADQWRLSQSQPEMLTEKDLVPDGTPLGKGKNFFDVSAQRLLMGGYIAYRGLNDLAETFQEGDQSEAMLKRSGPAEDLLRKQRKIHDDEYSGIGGSIHKWINNKRSEFYRGIGDNKDAALYDVDDQDAAFDEADETMRIDKERQVKNKKSAALQKSLAKKYEENDFQDSLPENEFDRTRAKIKHTANHERESVNDMLENWQGYGFKSYDDAKKAAGRLNQSIDIREQRSADEILMDERRFNSGGIDRIEDANRGTQLASLARSGSPETAAYEAQLYRLGLQSRAATERARYEIDPVKKKQYQDEATAISGEVEAQQGALMEARKRDIADRTDDYDTRSRASLLQSMHRDYEAEVEMFTQKENRKIAKIEDSKEKQAAIEARDAQLDAMKSAESEKYQDIRIRSEQNALRTAGRGGEADVLGVREEISRMQIAAGGDKDKLADVQRLGISELEGIRNQYKPKTRLGLSSDDYSSVLDQQAVNGQDTNKLFAAIDAIEKQLATGGILDTEDKAAFAELSKASQAITGAFNNSKPVLIVKN